MKRECNPAQRHGWVAETSDLCVASLSSCYRRRRSMNEFRDVEDLFACFAHDDRAHTKTMARILKAASDPIILDRGLRAFRYKFFELACLFSHLSVYKIRLLCERRFGMLHKAIAAWALLYVDTGRRVGVPCDMTVHILNSLYSTGIFLSSETPRRSMCTKTHSIYIAVTRGTINLN